MVKSTPTKLPGFVFKLSTTDGLHRFTAEADSEPASAVEKVVYKPDVSETAWRYSQHLNVATADSKKLSSADLQKKLKEKRDQSSARNQSKPTEQRPQARAGKFKPTSKPTATSC